MASWHHWLSRSGTSASMCGSGIGSRSATSDVSTIKTLSLGGSFCWQMYERLPSSVVEPPCVCAPNAHDASRTGAVGSLMSTGNTVAAPSAPVVLM
jgi:hypothetical protein